MAECSIIAWSERKTPGSIEPVAMFQTQQEMSSRRENIHKAESGAGSHKGFCLILFGVSNVEIASNVLDIKRSEPRRKMIVIESALTDINRLEVSVINSDFPCFQICHV